MIWRRAACESSACVEVGHDGEAVLIRSSLQPDVVVRLTPEEWAVFRRGVREGDFD